MNINQVKNIINSEIANSGYSMDIKQISSKSTSSFYYKIFSESGAQLLFRISDHPSHKNIITLRVDHRMNENNVKNFIKNRIEDLKKRSLKERLGLC